MTPELGHEQQPEIVLSPSVATDDSSSQSTFSNQSKNSNKKSREISQTGGSSKSPALSNEHIGFISAFSEAGRYRWNDLHMSMVSFRIHHLRLRKTQNPQFRMWEPPWLRLQMEKKRLVALRVGSSHVLFASYATFTGMGYRYISLKSTLICSEEFRKLWFVTFCTILKRKARAKPSMPITPTPLTMGYPKYVHDRSSGFEIVHLLQSMRLQITLRNLQVRVFQKLDLTRWSILEQGEVIETIHGRTKLQYGKMRRDFFVVNTFYFCVARIHHLPAVFGLIAVDLNRLAWRMVTGYSVQGFFSSSSTRVVRT